MLLLGKSDILYTLPSVARRVLIKHLTLPAFTEGVAVMPNGMET
jgi:hypothetical protein